MFCFVRLKMLLLLLVLSQSAMAKDINGGRYTMHQADDGFLRLDTQTGAVSHCQKDDGWKCMPIAGKGGSPNGDKIARLEQENIDLRSKITDLEKLLAKKDEINKPGDGTSNFRLPSEQEVDKALNYFESMIQKFQDRLKRLEQYKSDKDDGNVL